MVLRAVNKNKIHTYTLLTIKSYFKKTNFVTSYHSKNYGLGDNGMITSKEICQAMDNNQKFKIESCKSRK